LTKVSETRKAWRILRDDCHMTHHQVRAVFNEHFGGLALHKNLIYSELKKDELFWAEAAETYSLMLNNTNAETFSDRLRDAIWNPAEDSPHMTLTLARRIDKTVREWNPDWGESERNLIRAKAIRRLENHERKSGLEAWSERMMQTYLSIRGVAI
tara:strand:- start:3477 stop:3941 length:465 start_codon:yes stop_codon:yes gene_type:complete